MTSLQALESVLQHRPIDLVENILPDPHHEVRSKAHDIHIEGGVVQFA